jgi:hypothetical protein
MDQQKLAIVNGQRREAKLPVRSTEITSEMEHKSICRTVG